MNKNERKKKLIAEVLNRDEEKITQEDIERLSQYITENEAVDGKNYLWYLDCDNKEAVIDEDGNIVEIEDVRTFFNVD